MNRSALHASEKDRELARRIRAAGIPIACEIKKEELPPLLIRQDFEADESTVFNIVNAGAGLILPLKIVPSMPIFIFSGFDLRLDRWPDVWFRPLEDNDKTEWPHYDFGVKSGPKFARTETVNHLIAEQKAFHYGHPCHGLLLAYSHDPILDDIVLGEILDGTIGVIDQFEHEHRARIRLRVGHNVGRTLQTNPRRNLLSRPDII